MAINRSTDDEGTRMRFSLDAAKMDALMGSFYGRAEAGAGPATSASFCGGPTSRGGGAGIFRYRRRQSAASVSLCERANEMSVREEGSWGASVLFDGRASRHRAKRGDKGQAPKFHHHSSTVALEDVPRCKKDRVAGFHRRSSTGDLDKPSLKNTNGAGVGSEEEPRQNGGKQASKRPSVLEGRSSARSPVKPDKTKARPLRRSKEKYRSSGRNSPNAGEEDALANCAQEGPRPRRRPGHVINCATVGSANDRRPRRNSFNDSFTSASSLLQREDAELASHSDQEAEYKGKGNANKRGAASNCHSTESPSECGNRRIKRLSDPGGRYSAGSQMQEDENKPVSSRRSKGGIGGRAPSNAGEDASSNAKEGQRPSHRMGYAVGSRLPRRNSFNDSFTSSSRLLQQEEEELASQSDPDNDYKGGASKRVSWSRHSSMAFLDTHKSPDTAAKLIDKLRGGSIPPMPFSRLQEAQEPWMQSDNRHAQDEYETATVHPDKECKPLAQSLRKWQPVKTSKPSKTNQPSAKQCMERVQRPSPRDDESKRGPARGHQRQPTTRGPQIPHVQDVDGQRRHRHTEHRPVTSTNHSASNQPATTKKNRIRIISLPWTDQRGVSGLYTGEVNNLIQPHGNGTFETTKDRRETITCECTFEDGFLTSAQTPLRDVEDTPLRRISSGGSLAGTIAPSIGNGRGGTPSFDRSFSDKYDRMDDGAGGDVGPSPDESVRSAVSMTSLPSYHLGLAAICSSHMIIPSNAQVALKYARSLKNLDFAFVLRSSGEWTYSIVADRPFREDGPSIRFVVDENGSTKTIRQRLWASSIRLVNNGLAQINYDMGDDEEEGRGSPFSEAPSPTVAREVVSSKGASADVAPIFPVNAENSSHEEVGTDRRTVHQTSNVNGNSMQSFSSASDRAVVKENLVQSFASIYSDRAVIAEAPTASNATNSRMAGAVNGAVAGNSRMTMPKEPISAKDIASTSRPITTKSTRHCKNPAGSTSTSDAVCGSVAPRGPKGRRHMEEGEGGACGKDPPGRPARARAEAEPDRSGARRVDDGESEGNGGFPRSDERADLSLDHLGRLDRRASDSRRARATDMRRSSRTTTSSSSSFRTVFGSGPILVDTFAPKRMVGGGGGGILRGPVDGLAHAGSLGRIGGKGRTASSSRSMGSFVGYENDRRSAAAGWGGSRGIQY